MERTQYKVERRRSAGSLSRSVGRPPALFGDLWIVLRELSSE